MENTMQGNHRILGIDVGSVSMGLVEIDRARKVTRTASCFHHGDIAGSLKDLLGGFAVSGPGYVAVTSSTPELVAASRRVDNQIAAIAAARRYHPDMRAMLVVGGENFSLSTFDEQGNYVGTLANTSCAAGTGSFLDQQAGRLNLSGVRELSEVACTSSGNCPRIASRCAVFAKTDLIHAQQEGYQLGEISDGLCLGLAKNIVDTVLCSGDLPKEIVFCGGVSKNRAVVRHIEALTGIAVVTADLGHLYGAIGAAFELLDELQSGAGGKIPPMRLRSPDDLLVEKEKTRAYAFEPLALRLSDYPDFSCFERYEFAEETGNPVEIDIYREIGPGEDLEVYLGVDIGSTSTKAVLMEQNKGVLAGLYTRTAGRPLVAVQQIFKAIMDMASRREAEFRIIRCGTTGSGRKFIGRIIGADEVIDEITAHARAACELNPDVDTIIEIGGQDAKFTTLKNGRVTSSTMNNVCAAGTGSFIEEQAAKFGCPVGEYSARTENVRAPMASDRCTVFMERDMNHHLSEGYAIDEVLASALHSVRENYLRKVATEKNIGNVIFFQGATAKNKALVAAFEQRLQKPLLVSKFCHLTGALGTALILHDENSDSETAFRGVRLCEAEIPVSTEVCELCANHCRISVAEVQGETVAYGFLCGRDYQTKTRPSSRAFDLLSERRRIAGAGPLRQHPGEITIGLPAAVHLVDDLDYWKKFFDLLGINTVSSEGYAEALKKGKNLSQAEFCAPVSAMHGHAHSLLERADYVFIPYYFENKARDVRRHYCYYTQFLPSLVSTVQEEQRHRFLTPVIKYLYTSFHTRMELYRMLKGLTRKRLNFLEISSAFDQASAFDAARRQRLKDIYRERINQADDIRVVFLGRPYTVLSPSMNCGIPAIFNRLGIDTYYQDMLTYEKYQVENIAPLLGELHWEHASRIIEAAEIIAREKGAYPVYITSFKCSPDSFAVEYFKSIMDAHNKPYLILELDEHDSSVGYETRIEAAIRSFRNHSGNRKTRRKIIRYGSINPRLEKGIERKTIVFPNWDRITCSLLAAALRQEGYAVHLIEETASSIRQSLKTNTGQCIPLNAIAEGYMNCIEEKGLDPARTVLWLNKSSIACNIGLYPHHIKTILQEKGGGMEEAGVFSGELSFVDISATAAMNAYFAYMFGGMLRKVACRIRPYEREKGRTDRVLDQGIKILSEAFAGKQDKKTALAEIISHFEWIETDRREPRPKVALFGDLYVRDNRVMNQDVVRFIEENGGEVITTPYSEYAKMIARSYFRKWFNEGKYFDVLSHRTILATMSRLEKRYGRIFNRILDEPEFEYDEPPEKILSEYGISIENSGESMDNILKIHYIRKFHPDLALFVQISPALCCASLITEAMKSTIEKKTGVPVVSIRYDGTGGNKNTAIIPYLKYPRHRDWLKAAGSAF